MIDELVARIEVVSLEPGDILVVTYPGKLRADTIDHMQTRIRDRMNGVKVIVFDSGPTISVVRPADSA